jgi:tRNA-dihydrouridine synthase 4
MHKPDLVAEIVKEAKRVVREEGYEGRRTVSVKIRVHRDLRETVDFVKRVEMAGVDFITIHGRTRSTRSSEPVDLEAIKCVAEHCIVPTIANGDVFTLSDAFEKWERAGCNGVMSARGLLENPALFDESGKGGCTWEVVERFMNKVIRQPIPFKLVVHHLGEMGGSDRSQKGETLMTKEERMGLVACRDMLALIDYLDEIRGVRRMIP